MAEHVLPHPEPRTQLRTEPAKHRAHDDKYVSIFQSGNASVDLTFRDPILEQSADHFKVGVDEFTINLGSLSMLEYNDVNPSVLFQIMLRGVDGQADLINNWDMHDQPGNVDVWRRAFRFEANRPYTNVQEVMVRCDEISRAVSNYMNDYGTLNAGSFQYALQAGAGLHAFQIYLRPNGNLAFGGSRAFWANFVIEVPEEKYRQIIFGKPDIRYISMHPTTGAVIAAPYTELLGALTTNAFVPAVDQNGINAIIDPGQVAIEHHYSADNNLLNTLDRRVTVEVSCSLPIKNSPMVDHSKEFPDFALARFMFHRAYTMVADDTASNLRVQTHDLGAKTLQGPRDRVVFHHLRPQQKIHTLRMRIWARVRTYDTISQSWGMKTIVCPVEAIDYWHIRMHFMGK